MAESISSIIQCLFQTEKLADAHSEQLTLCSQLLEELSSKSLEWGRFAPDMVDQFVELVTECMNHRVLSLNEEEKSLLTPLSLMAAKLYARCLSLPGALHLIEMEAISALNIVLRKSKVNSSTSSSRKRKVDEEYETASHSNAGFLHELPVEETIEADAIGHWSRQMVQELTDVCQNPEFHSWSNDPRASLIESLIQAVSIAASFQQQSTAMEESSANVVDALLTCLLTEEAYDSKVLSQRHDTLVTIFRCSFPVLILKDTVPNGEGGKTNACRGLSHIIGQLVRQLTRDIASNPDRWPHILANDLGRRKSVSGTALRTPGKAMKSIDSNHLHTPLAPITPKLKGSAAKSAVSTPATSPHRPNRPRPVMSAIVGFVQKLATNQFLNRAQLRDLLIPTIHLCASYLPIAERSHVLTFWIQLCHSKVPLHRLVGCELVGQALSESWLWSDHVKSPATQDRRRSLSPLVEKSYVDMPAALFSALQGRIHDRSPAVRASSTSAFANMIQRLRLDGQNMSSRGLLDTLTEEADSIMSMLRGRLKHDDKASVRRNAVGAVAELVILGEQHSSLPLYLVQNDIQAICELCRDSATSTRKAAADALSLILEEVSKLHQKKNLRFIEEQWVTGVLPLVLDSESTCVVKASELVSRIIFSPITENIDVDGCPWRLLSDSMSTARSSSIQQDREALGVSLATFISKSHNPRETIKSLLYTIHDLGIQSIESTNGKSISETSKRNGVWTLFNALLERPAHTKMISDIIRRNKLDFGFVSTSWESLLDLAKNQGEGTSKDILATAKMSLSVLSMLSSCVKDEHAEFSFNRLSLKLRNFEIPVELINVSVKAIVSIEAGRSSNIEKDCLACIKELLQVCETFLVDSVASLASSEKEEKVARALNLAGELSLVGFSATDDSSNSVRSSDKSNESILDTLKGIHPAPSPKLTEMVLLYVSDKLPDGSSICESVRANSFITLGKFCLRDMGLAKRSLNLFARELHENMNAGSRVIQSNVLLVLGDLCVRYTNLVDRFLPIMAACLQAGVSDINDNILEKSKNNNSAMVRKHCILLLSSLLLQDYVKWRGLLFHRFLASVADEDEAVAEVSETVLCGALLTKQPRLFSNNFVESIFVLNRCTAHPIYQTAVALGDGGSGISVGFDGINLSGAVGRARRIKMYETMLRRMTDEEKIFITARIAKEIFKSALDPNSDLHIVCSSAEGVGDAISESQESAFNVLSDAFSVLSSKNMKVGKAATLDEDEIDDPTIPNTSRRVVVAKGRLLSNISRKHLIETIIPILCRLKTLLQKSQSSLLKDLMSFLVDIFRKYKVEVQEFLANDPNLLQELEYDAKQFKKVHGTPLRRKSLPSSPSIIKATA